jgi:SAM-dependent methyltransferase
MPNYREGLLRVLFRAKKDTDKDSAAYWNARWFLNIEHDRLPPDIQRQVVMTVRKLLRKHGCANVLEIGCGAHVPLRSLRHATHLDYSLVALRKSKLDSFIYADITKRIPVPDKTFDAVFSSCCLMHIPDESLPSACAEIERVTKKLVILNEGGDRNLSGYFEGLVCEQPFGGSK